MTIKPRRPIYTDVRDNCFYSVDNREMHGTFDENNAASNDEAVIVVNLDKRRNRTTSNEDRKRIVQCARAGGDIVSIAKHLGIKLSTCRAIAETDRDVALKRGLSKRKFSDDYVKHLCSVVDDKPEFTLKQLKSRMEIDIPDVTISVSSIDRLLDGHGYSRKKLTIQPIERNRQDVKEKRVDFVNWLGNSGTTKLRIYIDETNYNIWCSTSFGRSKISTPCIRSLPSSRGANLNVLASISVNGLLLYECYPRLTWSLFNEFLEKCSQKIHLEQTAIEAVFIFDNAPIHKRASAANLCDGHTIKYLPPYSPF